MTGHAMPLANRAGILCNDVSFRRYVGEQTLGKGHMVTPPVAAAYLRRACGIAIRTELNTNTAAAEKFGQLRTEFDAWRGLIGRPR